MNKREFLNMIVSGAVAAPVATLVAKPNQKEVQAVPLSVEEPVYDRVIRNGTIRCAYAVWPPIIDKNPNTGQMSGIFYDYMESIGKALKLKIEWVEEAGWGEYIAGLNNNRFDVMCAGVWPIAPISAHVDFTVPIYYNVIGSYVRADDSRFDKNITVVDNPSITISSVDGLIPSRIAVTDFPKAKLLELPQTASSTDMLNNVVTKKADITFTDVITGQEFMKANPGKLREVKMSQPIRVFGSTMAIKKSEDSFLRMLNTVTEEMFNSGSIEKILKNYETYPGSLFRVSKGYGLPTK